MNPYTGCMSEKIFKIIRKAKVGELDETMREEWDRLYTQRMRLEQEFKDLEEGMDAFTSALKDAHGFQYDAHGLNVNLRVEDNDVYAEFCPCPACQAELHNLTVVETVEQMYESRLLPEEGIKEVRNKAKFIDAKNKRTKGMLN